MANPRRVYKHDGVGYMALTYAIDASTITYSETEEKGSASVGLAVGLVSGTEDTVELVAAAQDILGRLERVESDGSAVVQTHGHCKLPLGNAVTVVRGDRITGALGASSARGYIGPAADTAAGSLGARHTVDGLADSPQIDVLLGRG